MRGRSAVRATMAALGLLACGDAAPPGAPPTGSEPAGAADFPCVLEHHGWVRCTPEGGLEWCHADYTPRPHFHFICSCVDFGLDCLSVGPGEAACALRDERCVEPDARCAEGVAENCQQGRWVQTRCGRRPCELLTGRALCGA